jgi:Carboxypeptidase regulatory-like domain
MLANDRLSRTMIMAVLLLSGMGTSLLTAQTAGTVSGIITDQSNAPVPDVKLVLQNVDTGDSRDGTSTITGNYTFALVPPGRYKLTAARSGFGTVVVKDIVVQVNSAVTHDITVAVAQGSEQVTVKASAVEVDRHTAALGEVVQARQIVDLPLNGRDFLQLATLSAGVNPPAVQNGESVTQGLSGGRPSLTVSVSGSREISPEFLFDGIPSKQFFYGAVGVEPPVDSLAEFKIQRGYFSPEFGAPAVVNVVVKSGTNAIHGAAWEFLRNDVLDARNFFDTSKPPYRQNQYGANGGGPAIKNKLFWFGDYEGFKVRQSGTSFATVPTTAMLQGNFSELPAIYDPATYNAANQTRQQFPNNQIPGDRISSFAQAYDQFIPAPNSSPVASLGGANLFGRTEHILNDGKFDVRVDYTRSVTNTVFARFSYLNSDESDTSILPFGGTISPLHSRNAVAAWTHVFSPALVNDVRIGLDRSFLNSATPEGATTNPDWPTKVGLQNLNQIPVCNGVPAVGISGYTTFGFGFGNCIVTGNTDKIVSDNLSYTRGKHTITTGFRLTRINWRMIGSFTQNGSLNFTGQFTGPSAGVAGDATADYLLGAPANVSGEKPSSPTYRNAWWPDAYVNDNFQVTRKFTVNLGLRWQFTPPPTEKFNNLFAFNFKTGELQRCGTNGIPAGCLSSHHADFAPRVGLAYALTNNWVIRSSFGLFYDRLPGNEWVWNSIGPPFVVGYSASSDPNVPTINISTLFPAFTPNLQGSSLFDLVDRLDPYLDQWTFSVQHTLPGSILAEAAYVGSKGTHLSKRVDANLDPSPPAPGDTRSVQDRRLYPQWGFILSDQGRGSSEYHGLQLTLRKEYSYGLTFLVGYTWAKSLDNDSYDRKATRNYRPGDMDKGRSIFDLRNRFVGSVVYDLPFGKNLTGVSKQLIQGWQLNAILTLQSGLPFQVTTPDDPSNTGASWIPRPNRICNGNLPVGQRTPQHWFDSRCFVEPAQNTYGNAGVAYLDTDGTKSLDFAAIKNFPIREARVQFRAESFNALNTVNFGRPGDTLGTPSFGQVLIAGSARVIQFALKLLW